LGARGGPLATARSSAGARVSVPAKKLGEEERTGAA
jgi:hypothetical protein